MTETSHHAQHEDVRELLGAYALDAVDPEEAVVVERHLAGCPRCRAELDGFWEVAAGLGNHVASLPDALWDRIAGAVAEPPGPPPAPHLPRLAPALNSQAEGMPPEQATGERARHGRLGRPTRWAAVVAAAAMIALVAFLATGWAHTDNQLTQARDALGQGTGDAQVHAALTTPGHQLVALHSSSGRQLAQAVIVPGGRGYLVSSQMAPLPTAQTYQLWALFGARAVSLGLMGRQPGHVAFTLASGHPTQLAVTVEPAGGVAQPDRPPVAAGALTS